MKIILLMILGHLIADYTLQGCLAKMKQKAWWKEMLNDIKPERRHKYHHDYIVALVCHALYWSLLAFLPLYNSPVWASVVLVNAALHAVIDDLKANRNAINLCQDQLLHLAQIVVTYLVLGAAS